MDIHTKSQRSYNMSCINGSKTKPELKIKKLMSSLGFVYQPKKIIGHPDFTDKKRKIAVFIDGCFWHKCPKHYIAPKQNIKFWADKIETNVRRDRLINKNLKDKKWKIIRIWEHELK